MTKINIVRKSLLEKYKPLVPFGKEVDLREWNMTQFKLWKAFVEASKIDRNNAELFGIFGEFFYTFWMEFKEIPELEEILDYMKDEEILT